MSSDCSSYIQKDRNYCDQCVRRLCIVYDSKMGTSYSSCLPIQINVEDGMPLTHVCVWKTFVYALLLCYACM